jgi:cytochrome c553
VSGAAVCASGASALLAAFLAATLIAGPALAQEAPPGNVSAGRKLVHGVCAACHGVDGIAKLPEAANLAGQDAGYIFRQLAAFKSGDRKNEIMSQVAQTLSDQQMADAAAYYAAVVIAVKSVPAN